MASFLESRHGRALAGLIALTVHLGLLALYYTPADKNLAGDERSYLEAASKLRAGEMLEPGLWPPLYPRLLALLGSDGTNLWRIQLVQTLLLIVAAALVTAIARRLLGPGPGAMVAGFLMVTYPPLVAFAHYLWPEILHLVLFLAAFWIVVARYRALRWMPVLGVLLGLALLSKSLLLPFIPVLLLGLLRRVKTPASRWRLAAASAALALTIAPTAFTSYQRTGSLSLSSSAWFNIWAGLRDTSRRSLIKPMVPAVYREYRAAGTDSKSRDQAARRAVHELVREAGLVPTMLGQLSRQYFRLFDKDSYLTAQLPGARLASIRQGYQGSPRALSSIYRWSSYLLYGAILVAAVAGLVVHRPLDSVGHRLVLAFLAYNLGLFLLLHVKSRYRIQMMPFLFLYSAAFVNWLHTRGTTPRASHPLTWAQRLAGALGGAVVMFLAYGAAFLD